jgi:hypothetical protein
VADVYSTPALRVGIDRCPPGDALWHETNDNIAGEQLGFDAVGIGDVNRDHRPDLLASAAEGDTLYVIAGTGRR